MVVATLIVRRSAVQQFKERLANFESRRRNFIFRRIEAHCNDLLPNAQEGTRLALADMFFPGKVRPTAISSGSFWILAWCIDTMVKMG